MKRLGSASLTAAIEVLDGALTKLHARYAPASDEEMLRTLEKMAEMFQVSVPEADGLELYLAALRELPRPAFVKAREALLREHRWPRLPYPVDFIEAAKLTVASLETATRIVAYHHERCITAHKALQNER